MSKKILCLLAVFVFFITILPPPASAQYKAEDITVPPGYKVVKIAETNKVYDPYRLTVDSSGHLIVASYGYLLYDIDPSGEVTVIGKTRKYNITPMEIEISPAGAYVLRGNYYPPGVNDYAVFVFTRPDTYTKVIENANVTAIGYDKLGNFYASLRGPQIPNTNPVQYYRDIVRYDANFSAVETTYRSPYFIQDFAFDSQNNLYLFEPGSNTNAVGVILKVAAGGDGIPGPGDAITVYATGLYSAMDMAMDDAGNIYLDEFLGTDISGYSSYDKQRLTKVDTSGFVHRDLGPVFRNSQGLVCRGNFLYASENDRGVISKVDLTALVKTDFTEDFGIDAPGPIAWDNNDNLYTSSFRQLRMLRLNSSGTFDQVGPGTGYMQSIAFDGTYFYIGSSPTTNNPLQILKIDPATGNQTQVAINAPPGNVNGWRSVAFDSFGRLILNTVFNEAQNQFGADIIDLTTGMATNYLTGIHNKGRCIRFDSRQNIYFVEGNGDGIKKIALLPNYSPPRDLSAESLFYNFVIPGFASPTIYFFAVNPLEELFVPRMDSGDVLFCDPAGNVELFAQGFVLPGHAAIDKYGSLYISDSSNGIFKIIHERWTIPAVIKLKEALLAEVKLSTIDNGVKNSLVQKLENADKDLEKGHITPAINTIEAFVEEVRAQSGKKIAADLATGWIKAAENIIKALKEVE
jgi:hypothetical protein